MPVYSEEHQTGEDAEAAFKRLFRGWVVRPIDKNDYGVDAEVDVVDEDRRLTGVSFKAQIKGTNAQRRGHTYSVRVKTSTLNYWRSQPVPVLVFYYFNRSGDAFYRWAHSYDPVAERKSGRRSEAKDGRIAFSFSGRNRVTSQTPERVLEEIAAFRALRDRVDFGSIPVEVSVDDALESGVRDELIARLHEHINKSQGVLTVAAQEEVAASQLQIRRGSFRFAMPVELSSLTVSHGDPNCIVPEQTELATFCADVMTVVAVEFSALGFTRQAAELYEQSATNSELASSIEARTALAGAYLEQGKPDEALGLLLPALTAEDRETRDEASLCLTPVIDGSAGTLTDASIDSLLDTLEQAAGIETNEGDKSRAAQLCYLNAGLERSRQNFEAAIEWFSRSIALDERYRTRGYFNRELGGCFADLERWFEAAECYERARTSEDRPRDIDFVLTDTLLHAGRYREALELASSPSNDDAHGRSRLLVLHEVAAFVTRELQTDSQYRHQITQSTFENLPSYEMFTDVFRVAASTDALDVNLLWKSLQVMDDEEAFLQSIFGATLAIAWMASDSAVHWVGALVSAGQLGRPDELSDAIADAMFYFCREDVDPVLAASKSVLDPETYGNLRQVVNRRRGVTPRTLPFTFRVFDPDGSMNVVEIPAQ